MSVKTVLVYHLKDQEHSRESIAKLRTCHIALANSSSRNGYLVVTKDALKAFEGVDVVPFKNVERARGFLEKHLASAVPVGDTLSLEFV